ncbi:hypothetical protein EI427_22735 [Flammeovirga pectinis]|uniref:Calcineurin-like phosphoesterase domain-containing protein n=1 Tax=Flammeovirga pectinis TaxID=2494373 RepID=A0A3S9PA13_9BACT|nr:BamA/TamA family outer membrane protein [Flammeovirga pectinis]AZQ65040.1 hypothetical protein EI427_22735 [Flammeovirga pectinis]
MKYIFTLLFSVFPSTILLAQNQTIYLIGDAGLATTEDPTLQHFFKQIDLNDTQSTVVFLGDNIYPHGLMNVGEKGRIEGEEILKAQLLPLKNFRGKTFMIPGNHDYNRGKKNGLERLKNEEIYVNAILGDSTFAPANGCPDPVEVALSEDITLLILDTQWLLFDYQEIAEYNGCSYNSTDELLVGLQDIIARNKDKKLIIAGHHPVYSYGEHGGHFTAKDHLFPLTSFSSWAYVPLPVIGSIYPLARKAGVNRQDLGNKQYQKMSIAFDNIFKQHKNLIYASGHEHALEYIKKDNVHYVVSGAGSKSTPVKKGKYAEFIGETKGFSKIEITTSGETTISFFDSEKKVFSTSYQNKIIDKTAPTILIDFPDSVSVPASLQYSSSTKHEKWMGANYRKEWETPVKMPVFNLSKVKGGLKIVQKGGGMATLSFRLEDKDGNQYTLRSIDKNPVKAIPEELKETIAKAVVQDQISAAHPYAPLSVSTMADAIHIYHANPKVVYVENDPQFGIYQELAANKVFMFEERPSKNTGDIESFGNAKKIYSTIKTVKKLKDDNDDSIDYKFTLRSRLFDMLIGDWDRHDDQWRWAAFKGKNGRIFRPIPRDRDQVFFVNEGRIPNIASHRWIMPKFEGFDDQLNWAPGFNFNARYFDRYFLAQADKKDWDDAVKYIQEHLTDSVFKAALTHIPTEVSGFSNDEIFKILKARRKQLPKIADEYYEHLSKRVSVLGSDKNEQFKIERLANGQTKVTVRKISKKGNIKHKIYKRTFDPKVTKEIRVYGFKGTDQFIFEGTAKSKIKLRVIGGNGVDTIDDETSRKASKNILLYDTKDSTIITHKGGSITKRLSNKPNVNDYDRADFKFNALLPILYGGYLPDDGLLIGGGFIFTSHRFRKTPFASKHQLYGALSTNVAAFKLKYKGQFTDVFGNTDVTINAVLRSPTNSNYFGLGNESTYDKSKGHDYYRFLYTKHIIQPSFLFDFTKTVNLSVGASYIYTDIIDGRYLDDRYFEESGDAALLDDPYSAFNYIGTQFSFKIDKRNNTALPKNGGYFNLNGNASKNINNDSLNYLNIGGTFEYYYTIKLPTVLTFAYKLDASTNFGDYHYLMSSKIGGNKSLRGFRRDRYYGRSSLVNSLDARLDIFKFKNSILPMTFGVLGFYDIGRVWLDEEKSTAWHEGYGGGIYVAPIDKIAFSAILGASEEELDVYLNIGFSF